MTVRILISTSNFSSTSFSLKCLLGIISPLCILNKHNFPGIHLVFVATNMLSVLFKVLLCSCFNLSLGTGKETEETNLLQHLSDACLVVDSLEPSVREELVNNFCSRELTSYEQIFEGAGMSYFLLSYSYAFFMRKSLQIFILFELFNFSISLELAKLDKTERRYAWIKRRIRTNEEIWKIFPPSWHVPYRLCIQFCKKTRYGIYASLTSNLFFFFKLT